jgi:hypothetical protein
LIVTGFGAAVLVGAGTAVAGTAVAGAAGTAVAGAAGAAVAGAAGTAVAGAGATGVAAGAQAVNTNKAINARLIKVKSLRGIIFSFLMNRTDLAIETKLGFGKDLLFL